MTDNEFKKLMESIADRDTIIAKLEAENNRLRSNLEKFKDVKGFWRELTQLRRDNLWLKGALGIALRGLPALVIRDEDIASAPEIEQFENIEDELVVRAKRKSAADRSTTL